MHLVWKKARAHLYKILPPSLSLSLIDNTNIQGQDVPRERSELRDVEENFSFARETLGLRQILEIKDINIFRYF